MTDLDSALFTKEYFLQDNICRFCWTQDAMIHCTLKSPLFLKVEYCLNIDLSQDDLEYYPKRACQDCSSKIEQFYDFKTFCRNANEQLKEILYDDFDTTAVDIEILEEIKPEKVENCTNDSSFGSIHSPQGSDSNLENIVESQNTQGTKEFSQSKECIKKEETVTLHNLQNSLGNLKTRATTKSLKKTLPKPKSIIYSDEETDKSTSTGTKGPTYCNSCRENFYDKETFVKHKSEAHGIEKDGKHRCFGCGKLFSSRVSRIKHESQICSQLENGYKCSICNKYLSTRGVYEKHMRNHRINKEVELPEDNLFKCFKCKEKFTIKSDWIDHMKEHAPKKQISRVNFIKVKTEESSNASTKQNWRGATYCKSCFEDFYDEDTFIKHKNDAHGIEKDGKYRCFGCGKLFLQRVTRLTHESKTCSKLENGYKCSLCNRYLPTRGVYEKHMKYHRHNKVVELPDHDIFKCPKCVEQFTKKRDLMVHMKENGHNKNISDYQTIKSRCFKSSTYCNKCSEDFCNEEAFIKHKSEAHGIEKDGKYRCFGCGKLFGLRVSCLQHESKVCHALENGYKCSLCNINMSTRSIYEKHMRNHRQNKVVELPKDHIFKCSKCGKQFAKKGDWLAHLKEHALQKEFVCETCGKAFSNRTYLNIHLVTHTGEKKYECAHCDYRCSQKQNLTIHIRTHTKERPYPCDLCPVRCVTSSTLLRHRRGHLGIRSYHQCPYSNCDKKFAHKPSLTEHIAINHEGTASNPCPFCGQVYLRIRHLRRHLQKQHPEEAKLIKKKKPGRKGNFECSQ